MLSIVDDSARKRPVKNRIPNAPHLGIYRRALHERPELVEMMREAIMDAITSDRYLEESGSIPNSTWLGSEILRSWEHRSEWNTFCGNDEEVSSALLGEIMWTVMFDDERHWCTVKTNRANPDREERVYFLCRE